ncbi:MAG TPA: cytochrome c biogenesis protein DipZ [Candidatus Saccharimonadales bacterium]|jgi:cytochrome c biogenesis protein CcdA/thiol-disulfide isomerase/thioredoxin
MLLLLGAFVAGVLTVLAPCVLPLLPIIIGGSVSGGAKDKKRPIVIAVSLAISLIIFTLLLKVTTLFVNIPPEYINYFSGSIIIVLGLLALFPAVYARIVNKIGLEHKAQQLLGKGFKSKSSLIGPIITGAALGPVFSSCSPFYGYILATVLPANFGVAMTYIAAYVVGLSLILLIIGYYGQQFIGRIKFASNPKGIFQRTLAIIFILVGLLVFTGSAVKVQTYVSEHTPFKFDALSAKLIPQSGAKIDKSKVLNVTPYDAPELVGLQDWINSQPLTLKKLQAENKVVLLDFWTYSCINCIRATPNIQGWYETYKDSGLVVIGAHAPEFAFERVPANVQKAVREAGITYPVALDNDFATWGAYENQYWPSNYLIDSNGKVRRVHYGEGQYMQTEQAIRVLLEEAGAKLPTKMFTSGSEKVPSSTMETPETYLGSKRSSNFGGKPALGAAGANSTFAADGPLKQNYWSLSGAWEVQSEKIIARGTAGAPSKLQFRVAGKDVYLVAGSASKQSIKLTLDGKPVDASNNAGKDVRGSQVEIGENRLYRLISYPKFDKDGMLELEVPAGIELNVFTFGS